MQGHPIFAAMYDRMCRSTAGGFIDQLRQRLLSNFTGQVLDLGAGTGANLPFFPKGTEVVALEPDPYMRRRGETRVSPAKVTWVDAPAEAIPFRDGCFDVVVATLVLCTVAEPNRVLAEVHRVLQPGGQLVFLEHVASDQPANHLAQVVVNPVWQRLGAGCNLTRDTLANIQAAGFSIMWQEHKESALLPFMWGVAQKAFGGKICDTQLPDTVEDTTDLSEKKP